MHFNIDELQLIHFTDQRMTTRPPAFDFEKDGDKAEELANVLHKKMVEWDGAGLSANQVGLPYRVFVMGTKTDKIAFFNPNVVGVSREEIAMEEGCLSFPDIRADVTRPKTVVVSYLNLDGEQQQTELTDLASTCIQHEIDHLNGIVFVDYLSKLKRDILLKKILKNGKF